MNGTISLDIEPIDLYEKAKKDLVQAMQSIGSLTSIQQRKLAEELFGAAMVTSVCQILNSYIT